MPQYCGDDVVLGDRMEERPMASGLSRVPCAIPRDVQLWAAKNHLDQLDAASASSLTLIPRKPDDADARLISAAMSIPCVSFASAVIWSGLAIWVFWDDCGTTKEAVFLRPGVR